MPNEPGRTRDYNFLVILNFLAELLFGCPHLNQSWPFADRQTRSHYRVCLDCGSRLAYSGPLAYPLTTGEN